MAAPNTITNLVGWWKADAIGGLSNGAAVTSWTDSSGTGNTVTNTGTGTTYQTNQINSLPAVHPSGTSGNYLSGTLTAAQPWTLFAVIRRDADNGATQTPVASSGAADTALYITTTEAVGVWAGTAELLTATGQTVDSAHIYAAVGNGASTAIFLDGTSVATGNPGTNGFTGITFGSAAAHNAEWFAGEIAEVIIYARLLNPTERALVHSYLSDKYALSTADYFATSGTAPLPVTERGSVVNATAATTSVVTLVAPTTIATGNYLIARVAVDNSGASGAAPGCTVTDARNTWTVLGPALSDPGVASAGATAYIAYAKVVTAYQAGDTLTFNWGGISTTAKAVIVEEWTRIHDTTPVAVSAVTNNSVSAATTTAVSVAITPTAANQLVYANLATEGIIGDAITYDADTTNGTWKTLGRFASANATATNNQCVAGQFKQVTASGAQTWNATITSRDWAALAVVFAPAVTGPPTVGAGTDASVLVNTAFSRTATETLNGGTAQARDWSIQAGPTGVGSSIGSAAALSWTPSVVGTYTLRYSLTTDLGTGTDDVIVTVGFLRGEVSNSSTGATGSALTLTLPASTTVGDVVVLIYQNNWYDFNSLATPTGTAVTTWVEKTDARYDGGTDLNHAKVWVGTVTTGGASTVLANYGGTSDGSEERYAQALVFTSTGTYESGSTTHLASSTSWTVPGATASTADCYYITALYGNAVTTFGFPAPMVALTGQNIGVSEGRTAWEWRSASGATGTRTVSSSANTDGIPTVLIIRQATVAPPAVPGLRRRGPLYRR